SASTWPLIIAAVLGPKALLTRPRLNQCAVDRKVLLRQQAPSISQPHHFSEQAFDHLMLQQAVAILGKGGVIPDGVVDGQAHKPAKQQVVAQLFAQLPFATNRVEDLQQQGAYQLLWCDRVTAPVGVDFLKP